LFQFGQKINLNITAIFTLNQIKSLIKFLNKDSNTILSIFAGRIADSGRDPKPLLKRSVKICENYKKIRILWASTREVYNIVEAINSNCHIITASHDIINKIKYFHLSHVNHFTFFNLFLIDFAGIKLCV
jgi:transaldolase